MMIGSRNQLIERTFIQMAPIFKWRAGRALEDELFTCLPDAAVTELLKYAVASHSGALVSDHIQSASSGKIAVAACKKITPDIRALLAKACATKNAPWFKSVSAMEHCGREIIGPALASSEAGFRTIVEGIFGWIKDARS